jgi:16S rRNA (guanine966-N2)-methyltransferase
VKQNKAKQQSGVIQIIAGKWRGRKIHFPAVEGLRPTPNRIRETVFNWLQNTVGGAQCLDLFAGSGVLGFEAASRGAEHVDLIEFDSLAIRSLQENKQDLTADNCHLIKSTAQHFLSACTKRYDIVFIDPPYQASLWSEIAHLLVSNDVLAVNAKVYLEFPRKQAMPELPKQWQLIKDKMAGDVRYCLFTHDAGDK